ncbi:MAG: SMC-Scp complex subunit ScpB [Patescibacteria group bacterium]
MKDIKYTIEALLFVSGEEMSMRTLKRLLGDVSDQELEDGIAALTRDHAERGVRVLAKDGRVQLVSAPEYAELVAELVTSRLDEELTPATLETLACIAYREPITKREIDELRGVNSIFSLRSLLMRGLIERTSSGSPSAGLPAQAGDRYRTTLDFLKKLGVERVNDLPNHAALQNNS